MIALQEVIGLKAAKIVASRWHRVALLAKQDHMLAVVGQADVGSPAVDNHSDHRLVGVDQADGSAHWDHKRAGVDLGLAVVHMC